MTLAFFGAHYRHELHCGVACRLDARQHVLGEFEVTACKQ
jgi:hypothetical protein